MKKHFAAFLLSFCAVTLSTDAHANPFLTNNRADAEQIEKTIMAERKAYAKKNINTIMTYYYPGGQTMMLGAGPDDRFIGVDAIEQRLRLEFSLIDRISMSYNGIDINSFEDVAWSTLDMRVKAVMKGKSYNYSVRMSYVLKRLKDQWFVVQLHASPIAEN